MARRWFSPGWLILVSLTFPRFQLMHSLISVCIFAHLTNRKLSNPWGRQNSHHLSGTHRRGFVCRFDASFVSFLFRAHTQRIKATRVLARTQSCWRFVRPHKSSSSHLNRSLPKKIFIRQSFPTEVRAEKTSILPGGPAVQPAEAAITACSQPTKRGQTFHSQ